MREKIIGQDFSVLNICLSHNWSTLERKALFDAIYIRDIGGNSTLLCYQDSQIDIEAEKENIPRVYISKRAVVTVFDFTLYIEFKRFISEGSFNIIHNYNLSYLWVIALCLRSDVQTPLFFTLNHNVKATYHNFISKWILKRIDSIFTLSSEMRDIVSESFAVSSIKVKNLGCGAETTQASLALEKPSQVACVINNEAELIHLQFVLKIFRMAKEQLNDDELKLSFYFGPKVYESKKARSLFSELEHEFYKGDISLFEMNSHLAEFRGAQVLIGTTFEEPISDLEIMSMMSGACPLFPRTAARQSFLFRDNKLGESYSYMDIRESLSKLLKILGSYDLYREAILEHKEKLALEHGVEKYVDGLFDAYRVSVAKRRRFKSSK